MRIGLREHRILGHLISETENPIQVTSNWAGKDLGFSGGLSGLVFAFYDNHSSAVQAKVNSDSCSNVFNSKITVRDSCELVFEDVETAKSEEVLGDVFEGECSRLWTNLVFSRNHIRTGKSEMPGKVIRPGLGHGELIRDFQKWYFEGLPKGERFESSEVQFGGIGWCNGLAGLLAAIGTSDFLLGLHNPSKATKNLIQELISMIRESPQDLESGLCHGLSGALVCLIGACRLYGLDQQEKQAVDFFQELIVQDSFLKLSPGLDVDSSWITGFAGIVWASSVMKFPPMTNPIFPPDSRRFP